MKKVFFFAAAFAACALFASCKNDNNGGDSDSAGNGCTCEVTVSVYGQSYSENVDYTAAEVKEAGFSSCSALESFVKQQMGGGYQGADVDIDCKSK